MGIAVAVVAVVALQKPGNRATATGETTTRSATSTASASRSASTKPASSATRSSTGSGSATGNAPSSGASGSGTGAKAVPIVVLNNTTTPGLASQAAARFRAGGWTVTSYGNYSNDIASTCAYYDPASAGAEAAARALMTQFPTIKRVTPKFAELPAGPVVVVLTPDYSSN